MIEYIFDHLKGYSREYIPIGIGNVLSDQHPVELIFLLLKRDLAVYRCFLCLPFYLSKNERILK